MLRILATSWWAMVGRGVLLILLGIVAFAHPGATAASFVLYASLLIIGEGIVTSIGALMGRSGDEHRWLTLLEGVLTFLIGVLLFRTSPAVVLGIAFLFGAWMIFEGVTKVALAVALRKEMEGEIWLGLAGVVGIVFGFVILGQPGIGLATLMGIVGTFAMLTGILLIVLGLRLRTVQGRLSDTVGQARDAVTGAIRDSRETLKKA